jgi:hypothetical protein
MRAFRQRRADLRELKAFENGHFTRKNFLPFFKIENHPYDAIHQ